MTFSIHDPTNRGKSPEMKLFEMFQEYDVHQTNDKVPVRFNGVFTDVSVRKDRPYMDAKVVLPGTYKALSLTHIPNKEYSSFNHMAQEKKPLVFYGLIQANQLELMLIREKLQLVYEAQDEHLSLDALGHLEQLREEGVLDLLRKYSRTDGGPIRKF